MGEQKIEKNDPKKKPLKTLLEKRKDKKEKKDKKSGT